MLFYESGKIGVIIRGFFSMNFDQIAKNRSGGSIYLIHAIKLFICPQKLFLYFQKVFIWLFNLLVKLHSSVVGQLEIFGYKTCEND